MPLRGLLCWLICGASQCVAVTPVAALCCKTSGALVLCAYVPADQTLDKAAHS